MLHTNEEVDGTKGSDMRLVCVNAVEADVLDMVASCCDICAKSEVVISFLSGLRVL